MRGMPGLGGGEQAAGGHPLASLAKQPGPDHALGPDAARLVEQREAWAKERQVLRERIAEQERELEANQELERSLTRALGEPQATMGEDRY